MEKLWTKPFILMTVGMLFLFTSFYLLLPTIPLFIIHLGGNESQVGLAMGVFTLSAVIFRPVIGGLLDRYGRRPFILWGLVFFVMAMYSYDLVGGIVLLLGLRMLHGVSWAASTTAIGTAITDVVPAARLGEGMGWFGMSMTVAMAIGPLLGMWVIQNQSFHALFLFAVGLSMVALILAFVTKVPFQRKGSAGRIEVFDKSVLSITVAIFFLSASYGGITSFLPLFAVSIHVNSGIFFLVYALTLTLTRPIAGKLSDKHGEAFVIVPALVVTVLALLVLSFSNGLFGVIASSVLYGIGLGSSLPALQSATLRLVRPDRKGIANASFLTAFDLGIGIGAMSLGWIYHYTGYQFLFTVGAVSVSVSLLIFTVFVKRLLKNPLPAQLTE